MSFGLAGLMPELPPRRVARGPLGVDIGSAAVKVLRWPGKPGARPDFAIRPLPPGAVAERAIRDADTVGRCIAEAVHMLRAPVRDAVTAVPSSAVMQRTLEMDVEMTDIEIEAQIVVEADRYIPYPLDEVCIDFRRLSGNRNDVGSIMLSVCRREIVTAYEQALERAKLRAAAVDVEHHAMERVWRLLARRNARDGLMAIADIGASKICLHVLADGRSIYCAERPFDGGMPYQRSTASFAESAARQFEQVLQLFHSSSRHGHVASMLLCGAAAAAAGLAEKMQHSLAMPVQAANPFSRAGGNAMVTDAPALLLAAGLAIPGDGDD